MPFLKHTDGKLDPVNFLRKGTGWVCACEGEWLCGSVCGWVCGLRGMLDILKGCIIVRDSTKHFFFFFTNNADIETLYRQIQYFFFLSC